MSNDGTAGYIITDSKRLRRPMQQITDYLLKCMGIVETVPVELHSAQRVFYSLVDVAEKAPSREASRRVARVLVSRYLDIFRLHPNYFSIF